MPGLHSLYQEYRLKGFEILSYSLDDSVDTLQRFREEKWPMPWLNAMDHEKNFEAEIIKDFEVNIVSKTVLIDEDRQIAAINPSEDELKQFLEEHLD